MRKIIYATCMFNMQSVNRIHETAFTFFLLLLLLLIPLTPIVQITDYVFLVNHNMQQIVVKPIEADRVRFVYSESRCTHIGIILTLLVLLRLLSKCYIYNILKNALLPSIPSIHNNLLTLIHNMLQWIWLNFSLLAS